MEMQGEVRASIVLAMDIGLCTWAYAPNVIVQCFLYSGNVPSNIALLQMFGIMEFSCGMAFSQNTTNFIRLILNIFGTALKGHDDTMLLTRSFITRMARSIFGTCSPADVQLTLKVLEYLFLHVSELPIS